MSNFNDISSWLSIEAVSWLPKSRERGLGEREESRELEVGRLSPRLASWYPGHNSLDGDDGEGNDLSEDNHGNTRGAKAGEEVIAQN